MASIAISAAKAVGKIAVAALYAMLVVLTYAPIVGWVITCDSHGIGVAGTVMGTIVLALPTLLVSFLHGIVLQEVVERVRSRIAASR